VYTVFLCPIWDKKNQETPFVCYEGCKYVTTPVRGQYLIAVSLLQRNVRQSLYEMLRNKDFSKLYYDVPLLRGFDQSWINQYHRTSYVTY